MAVELIRVAVQSTAVVALRARRGELSRLVPAGCGEVWNFIRASGFTRAGRNVALYGDWNGGVLNVEAGVEVTLPFEGDGRVVLSETPAGLAGHGIHIGPYAELGRTHQAVQALIANEGRRLAGPSWEVYGHWTDDASRLRTDVYYLIRD